jgi:hypothetical protein
VSALLAADAHQSLELLLNPSFRSRANREAPEDIIVAGGSGVSDDARQQIQAHVSSQGEISTAADAV